MSSPFPTLADPGSPTLGEVVYGADEIAARVAGLAAAIEADYAGRDLVLVGILKGAALFTADLVRDLNRDVDVDFLSLSRFPAGDARQVRLTRDLDCDICDRHLLLIEDLIDTGLTLHYLVRQLGTREPASIAICTLLDRPALRLARIPVRYVGFDIGDEFVVGYGLDYKERFRDLPDIRVLEL